GSGGGWPTTAADVCSAVDHLSKVNAEMDGRLDLQRVVVAGHSAGGHLALWVAGRGGLPTDLPGADPRVPVVGCVSLAGVGDMLMAERAGDRYVAGLLGGRPDERGERYREASPGTHLPTGVPVVCVHGSDDKVVRPGQAVGAGRRGGQAGARAPVRVVRGRPVGRSDVRGLVWAGARGTIVWVTRDDPSPAG